MKKFQSLLNLRLKPKKNEKQKVKGLASLAKQGDLSGFSAIFNFSKLNKKEEQTLSDILKNFQLSEKRDSKKDLLELLKITSEVKSITNQAIILHGERIKKAQTILKNYREGAFSSWLITTYGNRQTPYNFLQYFELYIALPQNMREQLNNMPRQAVYSLASRNGELERKKEIVENYKGETRDELLDLIRREFPLSRDDKRLPNIASQTIALLLKVKDLINHPLFNPSKKESDRIYELLDQLFSNMRKNS